MPYADFDRSNHPLIKVTFTGEKASNESFSDYLEGTSKNYERGDRIAVLFDASKAKFPALKHQKMQAKWLKENDALMRDNCAGIAYTIPNGVIRNALQLIFKIQKQPIPFKVFERNDEAISWLEGQLAQ